MGLYGWITIFPSQDFNRDGNVIDVVRDIMKVFDDSNLIRKGVCETAKIETTVVSYMQEEMRELGIDDGDLAHVSIGPEDFTPDMTKLVPVVQHSPKIWLPYLEIEAYGTPIPLGTGEILFGDGDGDPIGPSWAKIQFGYGDMRINPDIHRINDPQHPIFERLAAVLNSEIQVGVDIG